MEQGSELRLSPIQRFVLAGDPASWLDCGSELKQAAETLWKGHADGLSLTATYDGEILRKATVSRPCTLLMALALENVVKACLVAQEPEHLAGGRLSAKLRNHDLCALAITIRGESFNPDEMDVLKRCTDALPYWGRYPIPLHKDALLDEEPLTSDVFGVASDLFDRLAWVAAEVAWHGWRPPEGSDLGKGQSRGSDFGDPDSGEFGAEAAARAKARLKALS